MAINWEDRCAPNIQAIEPYQVGRSARLLKCEKPLIKLASNENLLGCSSSVLSVLQMFTSPHFYPDQMTELASKIADYHQVSVNQITLGNGSNDVLELLVRCFAYEKNCKVMASQYGFIVYKLAAASAGATFVEIPSSGYGADLEKIAQSVSETTRIILLANPNNPTGTWHNKNDLYRFLKQIPSSVVVVIDQAYFEYALNVPNYPNAVDYLNEFENLVVTGSFSKAFGLAAMRLGYGIANPQITDLLNRIRQPFNVNSVAILGADAALNDQLFLKQSRELVAEGLDFLRHHLNRLGIKFIDSIANFITIESKNAQQLYQHFLSHGLIVRPLLPYQMPHHLRVTIGLPAHQKKVIKALEVYV